MPVLSLPPPPVEAPLVERVRAWPRSVQIAAAVGAALAVGVGWLVFAAGLRPGAPPPELTMPRATPAAGAEVETAEDAYVHVAGAVVRPGVYRVRGDGRVTAVLDAAGGPSPDADVDQLNLAARVRDGERIYVPRKGEAPPPVPGVGGSGGGASTGPIDLNAATLEQLDSLPGVGPSTAQAILEERQRRGRFRSVEELLDVRGIGEARLASIRSKVRV